MGDDLPTTLLNLNQLRSHGIVADDVPCQFGGTHSLFIPQHNLRLPLQLRGVISCLPVRLPTTKEIETCQWIELTSPEEWDPKANTLAEQEKAHVEGQGMPTPPKNRIIYPIVTTPPQPSIYHAEPSELSFSICFAASSPRKPSIDATILSKRWGI
jgi:hypothetical protein